MFLNSNFLKINEFCARLVFYCFSFKLGSACILCVNPVFASSPLQSMVYLSSEVVSSAHICSLGEEALLLHLSLLVLIKFRVCSEQLQVGLHTFCRYTISSIPWKMQLLLVQSSFNRPPTKHAILMETLKFRILTLKGSFSDQALDQPC